MLYKQSRYDLRRSRDGNRSGRRLLRRRLPLVATVGLGLITIGWAAGRVLADPPVEPNLASESNSSSESNSGVAAIGPTGLTDAQALGSVQWLADLAMRKLPRTIDGEKDWGDTKRIWAGVKVRLDGGKLKTHRRWRNPEHGRWVRYKLRLPPVGANHQVSAQVDQVTYVEDESTGKRRWLVDSTIVAPLKFEAQVQRWNLGVKLFSVTVQGRMRLRLKSSATIGFDTDYRVIPPALVFDPELRKAKIAVESFEVDRVSHIGGDIAEGWGEVVQEVIVETYIDHLNPRLVKKLNRAIDKERDDLRISALEWFTWNRDGQARSDSPTDHPAHSRQSTADRPASARTR